jgi:hypothetical protein
VVAVVVVFQTLFHYLKEDLVVLVVVVQEVMDPRQVDLVTLHQHLLLKEMVVEVVTQILGVIMVAAEVVVLVVLDLHHQDLVLSVERGAVEFKF